MSGVGKTFDTRMEQSTFSASAEVKPSKSRSFTASNAVFQSVHQCSLAPKAHSIHNLVRKCPSSPVATDAGSANDEVNSIDLSESESCIRSTSCDADTVLLDGSSSDCESASLNGLCSQGVTSDAEGCDEVSCVYSVMLLLQLRAGSLRSGSACPVKYSTRSINELPADPVTPAEERKQLQGRLLPAAGSSSKAHQSAISAQRAAAANRSDDEKVARAARSILNKLTVEKFDLLHEKLATCGVKTPEQMALLMKEIFEKATEQHNFAPMYADLCVRLEGDSRLSADVGKEKDGEPSTFRRLLCGQCQTAFVNLFEPHLQPAATADEDPELADRNKQRRLGNVKLVGHLLVRGMLKPGVLVECADALLSSKDSFPEALEFLAALLTIIGPKFDVMKEWRGKERLTAVFSTVTVLSKDKSVTPRVRCLLKDVLDKKSCGWQSNGSASEPKGPMRLEDVKKQAEKTLIPDPGPSPGGRKPALPLRRPPAKDKSFSEETPKFQESGRTFKADLLKSSDATGRMSTKDFSPLSQTSTAASTPKYEMTPKKALTPANKTSGKTTRASSHVQPEPVPPPAPAQPQPPSGPFSLKDFHRELSSTLRDLGADLNVVAAVRRVRMQSVPLAHHSNEFVDIITRAAEEKRGPARRSMFAFAAGLIAAEDSAFDRSKCLEGVNVFFKEVYEELCLEVPRLQQIVSAELLPALKSVASPKDLAAVVPDELKSVL